MSNKNTLRAPCSTSTDLEHESGKFEKPHTLTIEADGGLLCTECRQRWGSPPTVTRRITHIVGIKQALWDVPDPGKNSRTVPLHSLIFAPKPGDPTRVIIFASDGRIAIRSEATVNTTWSDTHDNGLSTAVAVPAMLGRGNVLATSDADDRIRSNASTVMILERVITIDGWPHHVFEARSHIESDSASYAPRYATAQAQPVDDAQLRNAFKVFPSPSTRSAQYARPVIFNAECLDIVQRAFESTYLAIQPPNAEHEASPSFLYGGEDGNVAVLMPITRPLDHCDEPEPIRDLRNINGYGPFNLTI